MIISGNLTRVRDDGTSVSCDWIVDTDTATLVQLGGEGELIAEDVDLIAGIIAMGTPPKVEEP